MEKLIELANQIKTLELRKKVVEFLKDPKLSHKGFKKYPLTDIKKVKTPFSVGNVGSVERGDLVNHTIAVADICMKIADEVEKTYDIETNKDYLLAAAILHDVMKMFEWKLNKDGSPEHTGTLLDHTMLCVAELYHREFPEQVIHIVASHFGEGGPTPPRNFEALILHYVDTLFSLVEFYHQATDANTKASQIPLLVIDEETIKRLNEKSLE